VPDDERVLAGVDGHGNAQLLLGQAALAGLPVAVHGREHALAPLVGNLVVQPTNLCDAP